MVVQVHGRSAEDLTVIVTRIRGFNATALVSDSKRGLQVLILPCLSLQLHYVMQIGAVMTLCWCEDLRQGPKSCELRKAALMPVLTKRQAPWS